MLISNSLFAHYSHGAPTSSPLKEKSCGLREVKTVIEIFNAAFECVNRSGLDYVFSLCQDELNSRADCEEFAETISQNVFERNDWPKNLDVKSIVKIQNCVAALMEIRREILLLSNAGTNINEEMVVITVDMINRNNSNHENPVEMNTYQILARGFSIYLQDMDGTNKETLLMSAAQFLSNCKECLNEFNLGEWDLN